MTTQPANAMGRHLTGNPEGRLSKFHGYTLALMTAFTAMSYFDRTIMSITGPSIMREFGISAPAMGTVYSAFLVSYTILMVPGGALADHYGPQLTIWAVGLGGAVFTGLTASVGEPVLGGATGILPALLVIRVLFGICSAPLFPATGRMTANWFLPHLRARAQAIVNSGAAVGAALSPLLLTAWVSRYGWRSSFGAAAGLTALLSLVWRWLVRDNPPGSMADLKAPLLQRPVHRRQLGGLLRNRNLGLLTVGYFCLNYFEAIFFYWTYYYFGEVRHMGAERSGLYTSILIGTMVVSTPLGGWLSDHLVLRYGKKKGLRAVPVVGLILSAVLLCLGASDLSTAATVTLLSLSFGAATATEGAYWATAMAVSGNSVGAGGGIMNCGGNVGSVLAPSVTPLLAAYFGWATGLYAAGFLVAASIVIWFLIDPESQSEKMDSGTIAEGAGSSV